MKQESEEKDKLTPWLMFTLVMAVVVVPAVFPSLLRLYIFRFGQGYFLAMGNGWWLALLLAVLFGRVRVTDVLPHWPQIVPFEIGAWQEFSVGVFVECLCWFNYLYQTPGPRIDRLILVMSLGWTILPFDFIWRLRKADKSRNRES
jgi:hypothetical protein